MGLVKRYPLPTIRSDCTLSVGENSKKFECMHLCMR